MKKRIDFILLWKKVFGKLDNRDKKMLDAWLEADPENLELLDRLDNFQRAPHKISDERRDQAWRRLRSSLNTMPVRPRVVSSHYNWKVWYRAAAVLLIAGTMTWWNLPRRQAKPIAEVTIAPGRAKATLVTSGGSSIALGDSAVNLRRHGISAQAAGTMLTYISPAASPAAEEINTLIVPRGGEFELTLSDGTHVWLNSETTIRYPAQFTGTLRWVELSGEAYFEVTKDREHPFRVSTPGQTIAVLGTSFNVTAYPEDGQTLTTLEEGEIAVHLDAGTSLHVMPSYQSVFDAATQTLSARKVDTSLYTSWKDGMFIFEDEKLGNILSRLGRWYNVDVAYANPQQKEARFTAHVDKYESATEVLKLIQVTGAVAFEADLETIIVK